MGMFTLDTWKQQWGAFLSAPYIIASFMAGAGLIGWWLRGIKSGRRIDGLEAESKLANKRAAWAIEVRDEAIKAIEAKRQFEDLRAGIVANEGSTLTELKAKVEAAVEKLEAAEKTVRSAIAIAAGGSEAIGIGDKVEAVLIKGNKERLNDDPT
jgi:hypothetical protein